MSFPIRSVGFSLAFATLCACKPEPDSLYEPTCADALLAPAGDVDSVQGVDGATFATDEESVVADGEAWAMSPHSAVAADGSTWISWFSLSEDGMAFRVQRLDPSGAPSFEASGLRISLDRDLSWVMDHQLVVAEDGSAIVVFGDTRTGTWDLHAYRISAEGALLWGDDGLTVSGGDSGDEGTPSVALLADGELAVVWAHSPDEDDDVATVRAQRVTADGELRWPDALELACDEGYCTGPVVVPMDGSDMGIVYIAASEFMTDDRDIRARRLDADGCAVWDADVQLDGADGLSYYKEITVIAVPDGLITVWDALTASGDGFATVQRLGDDGALAFALGGVALSTADDRLQFGAVIDYDPAADALVAAWTETNRAQGKFGIRAQSLDAAGERQWGGEGLELVALSGTATWPVATRVWGDQALVWFQDQPTDASAGFGGYESRVGLMTVDAAGAVSSAVLSDVASAKSHVRVSATREAGVWSATWEDDRADDGDIMGSAVVASVE